MEIPEYINRTIQEYPPFKTREEEFSFYDGISHLPEEKRQEKMQEVALRHIPFVLERVGNLSMKYSMDLSETFDLALLGMVEKAKDFDPSLGVRFSTFISDAIVAKIRRPNLGSDGIWRENKGCELTRSKKLSIYDLTGYENYYKIPTINIDFGHDDRIEHINKILNKIDKKKAKVFRAKFGLTENGTFEDFKTLEEVGQMFNISKQRVEQICSKVIFTIRFNLGIRYEKY